MSFLGVSGSHKSYLPSKKDQGKKEDILPSMYVFFFFRNCNLKHQKRFICGCVNVFFLLHIPIPLCTWAWDYNHSLKLRSP